jgi:hypothetical protein
MLISQTHTTRWVLFFLGLGPRPRFRKETPTKGTTRSGFFLKAKTRSFFYGF